MEKILDDYPSDFIEELPAWQLVVEGIFTPNQLRQSITFDDVQKCHKTLEIKNRIEKMEMKNADKKTGN